MAKVRLNRSDLLWELECIRSHITNVGRQVQESRAETAVKATQALLSMTRARLNTVETILRRYRQGELY